METKLCSKCRTDLPVDNFSFRGRGRQHGERDAYCKKCRWRLRNETNKQNLRDWKMFRGGKCIKCGYDRCLAALDWHHRDPEDKKHSMASYLLAKRCSPDYARFDETLIELNKCDLLCSNCHREIHSGEFVVHESRILSHKPSCR